MSKLLRSLFVGAAIAALATAVWSQPLTNQTISGNECWNAGQGPGGPSQFLCINQVRNGSAMALISGSGAATTAATIQQGTLMWTGAAPASWAVTLPNPAFDGQTIVLGTDTTLTAMVTVTATTTPQNQTLAAAFAAQTITVSTSVEFQYNLAALKWFRTR
jgi:hypothetical protein